MLYYFDVRMFRERLNVCGIIFLMFFMYNLNILMRLYCNIFIVFENLIIYIKEYFVWMCFDFVVIKIF